MSVWAIVVAAGSGLRFGRPKQFEQVRGRTVLGRSVDAARSRCDGIVVVLPPDHPLPADVSAERTALGGATRSASVRSGLAEVPVDATIIVVHDAARPLASTSLFAAVVDAVLDGADAVVPAVPLGDSIRRVGGEAVDRRDLVAVQTPQGFAAAVLRRAHAGDGEASDDATLAEAAGARVSVVPGEATNVKLTHPADLRVAEALLDDASGPSPSPAAVPDASPPPAAPTQAEVRIGHGVDVHPFSPAPDRPLVLGGVRFADGGGLAGHSDADAVAHAVIDALLGAAGLGDIGQLFPDDDPRLAGADSVELLRHAVGLVRAAGWQPANVDCTVMTVAPRLAPRRAEMERRLGDVVGAPVTVKGKRAEGLGTLGRREGLACWAVALLTRTVPAPSPS